jgi:hypothetical protein
MAKLITLPRPGRANEDDPVFVLADRTLDPAEIPAPRPVEPPGRAVPRGTPWPFINHRTLGEIMRAEEAERLARRKGKQP